MVASAGHFQDLLELPRHLALAMQAYTPSLLLLLLGLERCCRGVSDPSLNKLAVEGAVAAMTLLPPGRELLGLRLLSALWSPGPLLRMLRQVAVERLQGMVADSPRWARVAFWSLRIQVFPASFLPSFPPPPRPSLSPPLPPLFPAFHYFLPPISQAFRHC